MTIIIYWWYWVVASMLFPFVWYPFYKKIAPKGDFAFEFLPFLVFSGCFILALGIIMEKILL